MIQQTDVTQESPLEVVLSRLPGYKSARRGYSACCPAHNDKKPSLSIWEDETDGHAGLMCYAGCQRKAICDAMGIEEKELYKDDGKRHSFIPRAHIDLLDIAVDKHIPPAFLTNLGILEKSRGLYIPYHNLDGTEYARGRIRTALKATNGTQWSPGDASAIPYGLHRLADARSTGYVVMPEGESDCWTLWMYGIPALGIPGATLFGCLQSEHITALPPIVYVIQETDDAGKQFPHGIAKRLAELGYQWKVLVIDLNTLYGVKDPNDLHKKLHNEGRIADFKGEWGRALKSAKPVGTQERKPHTIKAKFVPIKVIELLMNEMHYGDGKLFQACFEEQSVYDHLEKEWYLWNGQHWKRDASSFIKVLVSGHLGDVYIKACGQLNIERAVLKQKLDSLSEAISEGGEPDPTKKEAGEETEITNKIKRIDSLIKQFLSRSKDLRKSGYKNAVLDYATQACSAPLNDDDTSVWDSKKGLLGVKNGVLDLRTGAFREGRPDDYIRTVCPTEWNGIDAECPLFEQFLQALFELREDKDEIIQFLQRLIGYALTGTCQEALFVILCGALGRNGKTTLFKILLAAIGKALAGDIQKELLLDSGKNAPANGAKPDILALQGKRLAIAAETKKGDKLDISAIKHYTGGDELSGRPIFGKHFVRFEPTHTLFLHTNYKPHADADDAAFWARACLIDFNMRFVEEPDPSKPNERKYDPSLVNRIIENELPGVLAWIVRGALEYRKIGLKKPESVKLANQNYRTEEDTILTFIKERCIVKAECKAKASDLYEAYKEWSGGGYQLNSKEFPKKMKDKFRCDHTKTGSFYFGIGLIGDEHPSPGDEPMGSGDETFLGSSPQQEHFICDKTPQADLNTPCKLFISDGKMSGDEGDETFLKVVSGDAKNHSQPYFSETSVTFVTNDRKNSHELALQAGLSGSDGSPIGPSPVKSSVTTDLLAEMACATRFDMMLIGEHQPAPDDGEEFNLDAIGNLWCSKCHVQYEFMLLGAERGYPEVKSGKIVLVKAGQDRWLSYAKTMGHQLVGEALKVAQQRYL